METVTFNGKTFLLKEDIWFSFVDADGKECSIGEYALLSPHLHSQLGFTTVASVLKWWCKNSDKILQMARECDRQTDVMSWANTYFRDIPASKIREAQSFGYDVLKEYLEGHLRSPSLVVHYQGNDVCSEFLLVETSTPAPSLPVYQLGYEYTRCISLWPIQQEHGAVDSIWSKKYNYSYRMDRVDFNWFRSVSKESNIFFGMELEISTSLSCPELQYIVTDVEPKQEPFFIMKDDGSITGQYSNRVELVTVPCTPRYLRKNWKTFFQKVERLAKAKGKTIGDFFDTSRDLNNGLHLHCNKDNFIDKYHQHKFLTAWHQWDDETNKLFMNASERPYNYRDHEYCHIDRSYKNTYVESRVTLSKFEKRKIQRSLAKRLKGLGQSGRHCVAHDRTGSTIEVRLYQGIFELNHIMRCISFTEALFEYCRDIGYSGFDSNFVGSFSDYVLKNSKYASLYALIEKGKV